MCQLHYTVARAEEHRQLARCICLCDFTRKQTSRTLCCCCCWLPSPPFLARHQPPPFHCGYFVASLAPSRQRANGQIPTSGSHPLRSSPPNQAPNRIDCVAAGYCGRQRPACASFGISAALALQCPATTDSVGYTFLHNHQRALCLCLCDFARNQTQDTLSSSAASHPITPNTRIAGPVDHVALGTDNRSQSKVYPKSNCIATTTRIERHVLMQDYPQPSSQKESLLRCPRF